MEIAYTEYAKWKFAIIIIAICCIYFFIYLFCIKPLFSAPSMMEAPLLMEHRE